MTLQNNNIYKLPIAHDSFSQKFHSIQYDFQVKMNDRGIYTTILVKDFEDIVSSIKRYKTCAGNHAFWTFMCTFFSEKCIAFQR